MTGKFQHFGQLHSLNNKLSSTPISQPSRRAIIDSIFDITLTDQQFEAASGLNAYFCDWYEEQCEVAASCVSVTTHGEVLDVIAQLRLNILSREEILDTLLQSQPSADKRLLNASIDLAARLWVTVGIGSVQQSLIPGHHVAWEKAKLPEMLHRILWPQSQLSEKVKLPRTFTAANLERIAGLKVVWTSNLADHLCLKDDDTKVMLFHQASFLELHRTTNR